VRRRTLLVALGAACGRGERRLNVFNWSDYVAPDTIPAFERETGVRLRYGLYESAEEMLARVWSGNSGWDIAFPSNAFVPPMRDSGLLAKLDRSRLTNLANLDPVFRRPPWDPELDYCVPYMWGSTGIVYQRSLAKPVAAWADLWDAALQGRVTMLDDPAEVFAACLKRAGASVNSTDPAELARAREQAIAQKTVLRAYLNAEARDQLVAGDILAAQAWSITARQAIDAAPDRLAFVYPREGFPIYADCAVILRESKRAELAHEFIDYLLRSDVARAIAREMKTATCNAAARETPDPVPEGGEWFLPMPAAAQRLRDRLWTEIKAA